MIKTFLLFCKRIFISRLGLLLAITHLIIVIYEFAQNNPLSDMPCEGEKFSGAGWSLIAGRSFHWENESLLLQLVTLLDLPAIFIADTVLILFSSLNLCRYTKSWVEAILILVFASLQWLLIGYGLQEFVRSLRKKS
jgi:uncharacterized protein YceK